MDGIPMTRTKAMNNSYEYFDTGGFEKDLAELVKIPSQSQIPSEVSSCEKYLTKAMVPKFHEMGFQTKIYENPIKNIGPVLLATRIEDPKLTTILGYGHGDVILGLDDQWTKGNGPWNATKDGNILYGRGTADNKGQHWINMSALSTILKVKGTLGFNAKFIIETGEENGSKGLREVIESDIESFSADVFIASDGPRVKYDWPTISLGARGAINFDLTCNLRKGGHHSGNWGGALVDPAIVISHAISCITSKTGEIKVSGWRPEKPSVRVRELLNNIELDSGPNGPTPDPNWGEPSFSPAENVFAWNSFSVLAMTSGNPDNPVNAIAPTARAHCQLRYIAGTNVDNVVPSLRKHLDDNNFNIVKIEQPPKENRGGFMASRTELDNPWVQVVKKSIEKSSGRSPAILPQMGGSICNDLFTDLLGIPAIWIPHSYSGCSQHAPDEHVILPVCRDALGLMTGLYWDLGEIKN